MNDFRTQEAGSTMARCFTLISRNDGQPITGGTTVNLYIKNISGANAGKWYRNSDSTWQNTETANAMTHQADGHWTLTLNSSPWTDGDVSLEYAKAADDTHVPVSRMLTIAYTTASDSSGKVYLNSGEYSSISGALLDLSNGVETSLTLRQALRLMVAAAAGKVSGAASTTITIRNIGDSKNRIVATVDSYGNRSAITTDLT